ncbi:aldo/keto reductase [Conexibacter sp. DBS9H8]|uniref:aldo/keto reductase n=1 Tax=Conexibacter sp. DBS9H8 TaxID=2937801 RepID=UPI00200C5C2D|nr:aldo/keto reductase [Conexibacter sp. DBS9H8]
MTTSHSVPVVDLNDGTRIPQLGFGVFQIPPAETKAAVLTALEAGYRHIDTAEMYENEAEVGAAVGESGIPREEIWVTSKLSNRFHDPAAARTEGARSAERLGGYMDLFLIHWPLAMLSDPALTWEAMQELTTSGAARSLGVSNFQIHHLEGLARAGAPTPSVNQIELHPYLTQPDLSAYCHEHGIGVEAWSPIAQGKVLGDATLVEIAERHGRSPAQVTLRWHLQRNHIIFPKSATPERIRENIAIFDFSLSDAEMAAISELNRDERTGPDPDTFDMVPS